MSATATCRQCGATLPANTSSGLCPQCLLAGRYELLYKIAEGGTASVWCALDHQLKREVAVKVLRAGTGADSPMAIRFRTEAELTAQLQHPGIPAVHELGTLPDGRPFLVMKLVKGQTLSNLLAERSSPSQERGRFIAIFEQVCHAVGYAHAHGVIHRDLKPSNVMVGTHGEVQVMDWGLAKVLVASLESSPEEADDLSAAASTITEIDTPSRGELATRTGCVLGTPAYMPPEQAGGEIRKLNARSDVFGLGAILCQILTGRPPYRGSDANEIRLKAVRWEVEEAFAALDACGAEPELVALCKRCLAKEQAERPADARAVAAEVARIRQAAEERARQAELERQRAEVREAEQRKRRQLTLVAGSIIAAVLLLGLAVSLWQMWRAIRAEAIAVENEQRAITNAELARANEAKALAERDAKDRALKAERQARHQAMAALRIMTDELVERQLARSPTLTEENKQFLRKVIEQFEGLAAITADDADSRAIRAEGYFRVSLMRHRLGELQEAEAAYREAIKLQQQLAAEFPNRPEFRQDLAISHNNLGVLLRDTGRLKEAEAAHRDALAIRKQLAAEFPNRPDYRHELATSHANLGILLYQTGRLAEAEAALRYAVAMFKQLAAEFPNRPEFRQDLARNHNNLGNLLSAIGRPKEAEEAYREALAIRKQLAAEFPNRPDYRHELARNHNNLGNLLSAIGRPKEAEEAYREALAIRKQLAAEFPNRPDYRQDLAMGLNNLGIFLYETGRPKEAEKAHREALAIRKQLAAEFPNRPDYRQDLAISHYNLGVLLGVTGRPKEAEEALREALAIRNQLAAEFPDVTDYRQELAMSYHILSVLLGDVGQLQEAEASLREALAIRNQLAADFPNRPDYCQELARSHNNLGNLLRATGRLQEAEAAYREALAIRKQLAADFPNQPDRRNELACTLVNLANLCNQQRNFAAAKGYLDQAQPHHQAALKANPQHPTYRQFYHDNLMALVQAQAGLLDPAAAVQAAQTLCDLDWGQPDNTYDAARALAMCIPIVEKHEKLDPEQRKAAVQFYGDEAMKLLRDAVAKGFKDVARMQKDSDLDPLRQRSDFQQLLQELLGPR
jgi:tetratricopeptide (TPR) repeat protein/tRNA A-37 threonylcarbamoyl transferase component Bud32